MSAPFDPSEYTRAPRVTFAGAITLGRALVAACPKGMPAPVKKACQKLQQCCERAESAWTMRHREMGAPAEEDPRPLDTATDRAWMLVRERAVAFSSLPAPQFPKAARAAELVATLFPEGSMTFLQASYPEQLAAMQGILRRIDEDGLAKDLDAVCGAEFLANVRGMMPRYEAMVQGMLARDGGMSDNLRELLREMQQAIVSYATRVCATVDDDEPASAETARVALLAIANLRVYAGRRSGSGEATAPAAPASPVAPTGAVQPPAPAGG